MNWWEEETACVSNEKSEKDAKKFHLIPKF